MASDAHQKWVVYISNGNDSKRHLQEDANAGPSCVPPPGTIVRWGHKHDVSIAVGHKVWFLHAIHGTAGFNTGRPAPPPAFDVDLSFDAVIMGTVTSVDEDNNKFGGHYPHQYTIDCRWSKGRTNWPYQAATDNPAFREALRQSIHATPYHGLPKSFDG